MTEVAAGWYLQAEGCRQHVDELGQRLPVLAARRQLPFALGIEALPHLHEVLEMLLPQPNHLRSPIHLSDHHDPSESVCASRRTHFLIALCPRMGADEYKRGL